MALSLSQDNVGDEDVVGDGDRDEDGEENGDGDGEKDPEIIFTRRAIRVGAMRRGCSSDDGDRRSLSVPYPFAFPRSFLLLG
eukprot:1017478-Ditylum_brightwellii.AAC.1